MRRNLYKDIDWLFGPKSAGTHSHLWPRWLWLRSLGLIFFSAFYSLLFQIRGLIGPNGILPAGEYLRQAADQLGSRKYWQIPSVLWIASSDRALLFVCVVGLAASLLLVLNVWPRVTIAVCVVTFLSFVAAAQDFSSYQSDGMLLAAGFLSLFFAPAGIRPRLGAASPPSRASLFLLRWLWFQIYFESGVVKWASHDPDWRHLTALDHYYENGPLPDWIGWYAQQLPHRFQAGVTLLTLIVELGIVWMLFLPRRYRLLCFAIVTPFQIGIILTANLAFLNYFVLTLGFLLLDDQISESILGRVRSRFRMDADTTGAPGETPRPSVPMTEPGQPTTPLLSSEQSRDAAHLQAADAKIARELRIRRIPSLVLSALFLSWIFYNTAAQMLLMLIPTLPLPAAPIEALQPFRISDRYGLFAVMTTARYEIEFQGSSDGVTWTAYPFRYKPQDPAKAPGIYAPYQPRFDWNLWFSSLGSWRENPIVVNTEARLLENSPQVLTLFTGNPFGASPPRQVRAVAWQYWFTDLKTRRSDGTWWHRKYLGLYAPTLEREADGKIVMVEVPDSSPAQ